MGKRLHVQKKHIIEYADDAFFNWSVEEVNTLLCNFIDCYWGNDEEYGSFSNMVEVDKEQFKEFLDKLKDPVKRQEMFGEADYELPKEISNIDYLIKGLEYFYENADPDDNVIHLDWF